MQRKKRKDETELKTDRLIIRIEPRIKRALEQTAKRLNRSPSNAATTAILEFIERNKKQ